MNEILTNVKKMIVNSGPGIPSAEDKALEEKAAEEFAEDMANQPDFPTPIGPSENKVFGAKNDGYILPLTTVDDIPEAIQSPEDMEKEYISQAEKTIKEFGAKNNDNIAAIKEMKDKIEGLETAMVSFDRIIAGAKAGIEVVKPQPKVKATKQAGAK